MVTIIVLKGKFNDQHKIVWDYIATHNSYNNEEYDHTQRDEDSKHVGVYTGMPHVQQLDNY